MAAMTAVRGLGRVFAREDVETVGLEVAEELLALRRPGREELEQELGGEVSDAELEAARAGYAEEIRLLRDGGL